MPGSCGWCTPDHGFLFRSLQLIVVKAPRGGSSSEGVWTKREEEGGKDGIRSMRLPTDLCGGTMHMKRVKSAKDS